MLGSLNVVLPSPAEKLLRSEGLFCQSDSVTNPLPIDRFADIQFDSLTYIVLLIIEPSAGSVFIFATKPFTI